MPKKIIQSLMSGLRRNRKKNEAPVIPATSFHIIPAQEHHLAHHDISEAAIRVIDTLRKHQHAAYLVGGSVRDLLLGLHPKDFDVATDATPEQVTRLFRSAMIIGRRFKIVHVRFGRDMIEVTTFRGHHHEQDARKYESKTAQKSKSGMLTRDNVYGSMEEDALRRDFTVNALYYDIDERSVLDYTQGREDLQKRCIRIIGDAEQRYREDPVRMLRAIRLAAKLDFSIEEKTAERIQPLRHLLKDVAPARLFDEMLKLFAAGYGENTLSLLQDYQLFDVLFPQSAKAMEKNEHYQHFVDLAMLHTDDRIHADKRISPAYLFATLLWPAFQEEMARMLANPASSQTPAFQAMHMAADAVIHQLTARITLPKRFSAPMKEIWQLQSRLEQRHGNRAQKLFEHPRFRAAYDFVLLREEAGENLNGLGQWWTDYQATDESGRLKLMENLSSSPAPRKRRRSKK
jgi:poly(A) polymerase